MSFGRRDLLVAGPAAGLLGVLGVAAAKGAIAQPASDDLYRVDDPETIMTAARHMITEDWV